MKKIYLAGCKGGIQKMTGRTGITIVDMMIGMEKIDEKCNQKKS